VIDRWDDIYYRVNNLSIGVVTLFALVSELFSLNTFRKKQSGFSLKEWLEKSISLINKDLKQRISYYILPFIAVPTILSIHVYYSQDSFLDIFKNEETIFGLIFGFLIGILVAYVFIVKYRKYQLKNLGYLKELYHRLCNEG
jgi:hypothetical protein